MRRARISISWGWATLAACLLGATDAAAIPYGFSCITNTSAANCGAGVAQLSVDITSVSATQVRFDFSNAGPLLSSITDVYFADGTLLGIAGLVDRDDNYLGPFGDAGVDFSQGASPPELPGGNLIGFVTTAGFLADSDPPAQPNGVNPGETLGVVFNLKPGGSFATVLSQLLTGQLRIGIHVQGFSDGGSESFVNNPVPEPGTAMLLGLGLSALAMRRRPNER